MESRVLLDKALSLLEAVLSHLNLGWRELLVQRRGLGYRSFGKEEQTTLICVADKSSRYSVFL